MTIKTRYIFILMVLAILTALALSTCFSSYSGGTGTLTINIGGGNNRAAFEPAEIKAFTHTITLTGPGEPQTETIEGEGSVTFELIPGTWNIEVRAVGKTPDDYLEYYEDAEFPHTMLRALSRETVEIITGPNKQADIKMEAATEVRNSKQLEAAIDIASLNGRKEVIFILEDITLEDTDIFIQLGSNITFLADKPVKISFPSGDRISININENSKLSLGRKGMSGYLTIDSNKSIGELFIVRGGELIMEEGVTIQNGSDNAVTITTSDTVDKVPGNFTMNGGKITGNKHPSIDGGAVYVANFCSFTMNGGEISENDASNGGGVFVDAGGKFTMEEGSTISGNKASDNGGGVYVGNLDVGPKGEFYMKGGIISDNEASICGGGVYVGYGDGYGIFTKSGGTIYGNDVDIIHNNRVLEGYQEAYTDKAYGFAVLVDGNYSGGLSAFDVKRKILDTTAGPGINLDAKETIGWTSPD